MLTQVNIDLIQLQEIGHIRIMDYLAPDIGELIILSWRRRA